MEEKNLTLTEVAKQMKTNRTSLDQLLYLNNTSVTLATIDRAAIIGKQVRSIGGCNLVYSSVTETTTQNFS